MNRVLLESQIVPIYIVYEIIKKLCTPFIETQAYKLGIIDEKGKVLRKRRTLKTREEKEAYTMFDTLVFNIKKLIEKLPGGKTRLFSYAAALWLISEAKNYKTYIDDPEYFEEEMTNFLESFQVSGDNEDMLSLVDTALEHICEDGGGAGGGMSAGGMSAGSSDIANVTGKGVATDIPFKPMVKKPLRRLHLNFLKMYEEIKEGKND